VVHHRKLSVASILVGDVSENAGDSDHLAVFNHRFGGDTKPPDLVVGALDPIV